MPEALALTADRVGIAAGVLVSESLKKRQARIYRPVPVPLCPAGRALKPDHQLARRAWCN